MKKEPTDTRTTILKVALQLFLLKGYKDVTYQDLIKKTGLSKGAIYHHFESKEDILTSVFEYMYEASNKTIVAQPEKIVKDKKSFIKLYTDIKREQMEGFKEFLGTKKLEFNRFLFFFEAIIENEKLRKISAELLQQEIKFLEKCFIGLKQNDKHSKWRDPLLLATTLYYMLEGAGIIMFLTQKAEKEGDWIDMYKRTLEDFFKIV